MISVVSLYYELARTLYKQIQYNFFSCEQFVMAWSDVNGAGLLIFNIEFQRVIIYIYIYTHTHTYTYTQIITSCNILLFVGFLFVILLLIMC
jgi:hypothetical protein